MYLMLKSFISKSNVSSFIKASVVLASLLSFSVITTGCDDEAIVSINKNLDGGNSSQPIDAGLDDGGIQ